SIVLPCHPVHSRCSPLFELVITAPQLIDRHMVQQGRERIFLFPFATLRTCSSPLGPLSRLCVRHGLGRSMFSLVSGLSSASSAGSRPPLFGCLAGTTPLYDSPSPCV